MSDNIHVVPVKDLAPHNSDSEICVCNPKIEIQENGNKLIIHNAFDHREIFERYVPDVQDKF